MRIMKGDVVFQRDGSPALVKNVDVESGKVLLDYELGNIQKASEKGVKNSLEERQRSAYNLTLRDVESADKKEEIQNLYDVIDNLKTSRRSDPKLIRYLENELMHRMHRENYTPPNYEVDLENLPQY
ncbi:hypothetical protein EBU99_01735 [bacterium]|nr:hypothetical protein [bacterium]